MLYCYNTPFDLHVLGLPLAFILSQDQTLHCNYSYNFLRSYFICQLPLASSPTDYNKCSTLRSINYYHSLTRIFCELLHIEVPRKVRYQVSFIQRTCLSAVANTCGLSTSFLKSFRFQTHFFKLGVQR